MDLKRPIEVGVSSSLIDLKAELARKQSELLASKSKGQHGVTKSISQAKAKKAKSPWASSNVGVALRASKDQQQMLSEEEQLSLEKSKAMLEAKSRLYEQMEREALGYDEKEHPVLANALVNFTQKAIDDLKAKKPKSDQEDEELAYTVDDDEWTEFTDALGRQRRCLKADLPSFMARDDEFCRPLEGPAVQGLSKEAQDHMINIKQAKWDKEAQENAFKQNIHYQDVLFEEVRTHGVGYYGFSKDEIKRQEQMKELKKLSEQTDVTREKVLRDREAKDLKMKERLKRIKAKKRAKLGLPPLDDDEEEEGEKPPQEPQAPQNDPQGETPQKDSQGEAPSEKTMRPWDFGKTSFGLFGPRPQTFDELDEKWLRERRADRVGEFAPPTNYYSQGGLKRGANKKYSNFVKSSSPATSSTLQKNNEETSSFPGKTERIYQPEPFCRKSENPIPIVNEVEQDLSIISETNRKKDFQNFQNSQRRGVEIAPPPTFEYYHGNSSQGRNSFGVKNSSAMELAIEQGLKNLRQQFTKKNSSKDESS